MCYCHNCKRYFHPLGIMSHRATHRRKQENCTITYSHGNTYEHDFARDHKIIHTEPPNHLTMPKKSELNSPIH